VCHGRNRLGSPTPSAPDTRRMECSGIGRIAFVYHSQETLGIQSASVRRSAAIQRNTRNRIPFGERPFGRRSCVRYPVGERRNTNAMRFYPEGTLPGCERVANAERAFVYSHASNRNRLDEQRVYERTSSASRRIYDGTSNGFGWNRTLLVMEPNAYRTSFERIRIGTERVPNFLRTP